MNKKVIRTIAAVTAAALLGGGIYLLVKNDVAQKINWRDILIYAPTPIARETLDEAVDIEKSKAFRRQSSRGYQRRTDRTGTSAFQRA